MRCVKPRRHTVLRGLGAAALLGLLAGCSSVTGDEGAAAPTGDSLATKLLLGNMSPPPLTPPVDDDIKKDCPPIEVLPGTASIRVYENQESQDPFSLRYQATLADTARQCSKLGVEAAIRVGVTGRVIVGPKGAPATVRAPLRIAVVDEADRPVYSQVRMIDVAISPADQRGDFSHIEEGIVIPVPANRFRGWRILVGYDVQEQAAAKPQAAARPKPRVVRRRPAPAPAAPAPSAPAGAQWEDPPMMAPQQ
jgi:hypothetical protein